MRRGSKNTYSAISLQKSLYPTRSLTTRLPVTIINVPRSSTFNRTPTTIPYLDRRLFYPSSTVKPQYSPKPAGGLNRRATTLTALPNTHTIGFSDPARVSICHRRSQRKEVLHALRKTGKGSTSRLPRRKNHWSDVQC